MNIEDPFDGDAEHCSVNIFFLILMSHHDNLHVWPPHSLLGTVVLELSLN